MKAITLLGGGLAVLLLVVWWTLGNSMPELPAVAFDPTSVGSTVDPELHAAGQIADPERTRVEASSRDDSAAHLDRPIGRDHTSRPARLTVRAVTAEGSRLDACRFHVRSVEGDSFAVGSRHPMQAAQDGASFVEGLPAGQYHIMCEVPLSKAPVATIAWDAVADVAIEARVGAMADLVGGIARHIDGRAAVGLLVRDASSATTAHFCRTDARGRFLFLRRQGGSGESLPLAVADEEGEALAADLEQVVHLAWGVTEQAIVVYPRAPVHVRLLDQDGEQVSTFRVEVSSDTLHGRVHRQAVAQDGLAAVRGVPTGVARVWVVPEGELQPVSGSVVVRPDGSGDVLLRSRRGSPLDVMVRASSGGLPVTGVTARLRLVDGGTESDAGRPDKPIAVQGPADLSVLRHVVDGRVVFCCDVDSEYELTVEATGFSPHERRLRSEGGKFSSVTVILEPVRALRLQVVPIESVGWLEAYRKQAADSGHGSLQLVPRARKQGSTRTAVPDADGNVVFQGLTAGEWLLWLRGPWRPWLVAEVRIGDADVDLPAVALGHMSPGRLRGTITGTPERTVPRRISAIGSVGRVDVPLDATGRFDVIVPADAYTLRAALATPGGVENVLRVEPVEVRGGGIAEVSWRPELLALHVRVLDESGRPMEGLALSVDEERATGSFKMSRTDGGGLAVVYPCPVGEFGLSALHEGTQQWRPLTRTVAGVSEAIQLTMPR